MRKKTCLIWSWGCTCCAQGGDVLHGVQLGLGHRQLSGQLGAAVLQQRQRGRRGVPVLLGQLLLQIPVPANLGLNTGCKAVVSSWPCLYKRLLLAGASSITEACEGLMQLMEHLRDTEGGKDEQRDA